MGAVEPPRDPDGAWTWRQLNDELDRRAGVSLEALQSKAKNSVSSCGAPRWDSSINVHGLPRLVAHLLANARRLSGG